MTALKNCWCSGEARMKRDDNGRYSSVECVVCKCATIYCITPEEAETIWNEGSSA